MIVSGPLIPNAIIFAGHLPSNGLPTHADNKIKLEYAAWFIRHKCGYPLVRKI